MCYQSCLLQWFLLIFCLCAWKVTKSRAITLKWERAFWGTHFLYIYVIAVYLILVRYHTKTIYNSMQTFDSNTRTKSLPLNNTQSLVSVLLKAKATCNFRYFFLNFNFHIGWDSISLYISHFVQFGVKFFAYES